MSGERSENETLIERLVAIDLRPGDVVWVQTPKLLSMDAMGRLRSLVQDAFPEHQVVVTPPGYDLSAFRPAPIPDSVKETQQP